MHGPMLWTRLTSHRPTSYWSATAVVHRELGRLVIMFTSHELNWIELEVAGVSVQLVRCERALSGRRERKRVSTMHYSERSSCSEKKIQEAAAAKCRNFFESLWFMAALCNRAGHYIFILWFLLLSSSSSFLFPRLISTVADSMSAILPQMVCP